MKSKLGQLAQEADAYFFRAIQCKAANTTETAHAPGRPVPTDRNPNAK